MRDDIAAFARFLLNLLEEKNGKIRTLLENENEIISKLISHDRDGAEELIEENGDLTESIDLINYDMSENRRSLSSILGVDPASVDKTLASDDSVEGSRYRTLLDETNDTLSKCIHKADEIIELLAKELHDTESSIRACESIRKVKYLTGISFDS